MAVTKYLSYLVPSSQDTTNRRVGVNLRFFCDTFAELPTGTATIDGDTAFAVDTSTRYERVAGAWVVSAIAGGTGLTQAQALARNLGC